MDSTELKPCPFCGGAAILCKEYPPDVISSVRSAVSVKCQRCGCNTGAYIENVHYTNNLVRHAINAWNRRTSDA